MSEIKEAMIFAAGYGTRMLPITETIPKPLVKINNKPLIFYLIEELIDLNFKNIVVNCHYLSEKIYSELEIYEPKVKIIFEKKILDTGGGFLNAIKKQYFKNIDSPIVLLNGDIFWIKKKKSPIENLLRNWKGNKMDLLLCLKDKKIIHGYKNGGDFDLENPKKKLSKILINSGRSFVFSGIQIVKAKKIVNIKKERFSMREIFLSGSDYKIYGLIDDSEWFHISNPDDLDFINRYLYL